MLREIVLFYPEVTRILCVEMIKSLKSSQHTEPSPVLCVLCVMSYCCRSKFNNKGVFENDFNSAANA